MKGAVYQYAMAVTLEPVGYHTPPSLLRLKMFPLAEIRDVPMSSGV